MGGMWRELTGTLDYAAGSSGTVTLPAGASIHYLWCLSTAGGTLTIFGGPSITLPANVPFVLDPKTDLFQATTKSALASGSGFGTSLGIVFTTTVSYFVSFFAAGNT